MVARPTLNFREVTSFSDDDADMGRRVRALENAVRELAQRTQSWLESYAPADARSPVAYAKVKESGNLPDVDFAVFDVYSAAALTLTMPAHKQGRLLVVKDGSGNAGTFNLTLKRKGSAGTINGVEGDYVISNNNEYVWLVSDGTNKNWRRITFG